MKTKFLFLTLFLTVGFSFQNCIDCGCSPFEGNYFDIKGLTAIAYKNNYEVVPAKDTVSYQQFLGIQVPYTVSFHANSENKKGDFMNSAFACDCPVNGDLGSKEGMEDITIITLNDFSAPYKAGSIINDLFKVENLTGKAVTIDEYVLSNSTSIRDRGIYLLMAGQPESNIPISLKIIVDLKNGESYEVITPTIVFKP